MPTCIYCRCEDQEFDREHVIPEALGVFEPISFILYETVCKECNNYFGRTLDLALSRDSMEALLRFRYGTKPASEAGDLPYRKLELKIGQPGPPADVVSSSLASLASLLSGAMVMHSLRSAVDIRC